MYLVYDTETNGFPPKARMTQLAFILYAEDGTIIEQFESLIKPDGWVIPKQQFFIDNNMSTERCEEHGIPVFDALRRLQDALKQCSYKIAHNHNFDNQIVTNEIAFAGIEPALFKYKKSFCTMLSTVEYVGAINKWGKPGKWPNLMELHNKVFGCDFEGAHDALDDVKATGNCFFELKRKGIIKI
jgi:DNA polymerase-3 subunit epsilon